MIDLPADLPADLAPLSWLIGQWEGTGVIDYDAEGHRFRGEFHQRLDFRADGTGALQYAARAWIPAESGRAELPLVSETGFWRLSRPSTEGDPGPALLPAQAAPTPRTAADVDARRTPAGGFALEVCLAHSDGSLELYLGEISGPRIEIATDAIIRPAGGVSYVAATRMYGMVEGHLLWAWDIAARGSALASHASARLART